MEKKSIAIMTAGLGAGTVQTFILREYVDKKYGLIPGLEGLKGFGTYSAIGGIITGGVTTVLGLVSVLTKKITKNESIQMGLISYGIPALSGGILSGIFPHPSVPIAGAQAPVSQLNKAQGASQVNLRFRGKAAPGQGGGQLGAIPLRT